LQQGKVIILIRIILVVCIIIWGSSVYILSSQDSIDSSKLSSRVIIKILKTKDELTVKYKNFKIKISGEDKPKEVNTRQVTQDRVDRWQYRVRKAAHFTLYMVGGFIIYLTCLSFTNEVKVRFKNIIISILGSFLYACSDEFHQKFSYGRSSEIKDVLIDTTGAIFGILIAIIIVSIIIFVVDLIMNKRKKAYD